MAGDRSQVEGPLACNWMTSICRPTSNGDLHGLIRLIEEKTQGDHYAISGKVQSLLCQRQPAIRWLLDVMCGSGAGTPASRRPDLPSASAGCVGAWSDARAIAIRWRDVAEDGAVPGTSSTSQRSAARRRGETGRCTNANCWRWTRSCRRSCCFMRPLCPSGLPPLADCRGVRERPQDGHGQDPGLSTGRRRTEQDPAGGPSAAGGRSVRQGCIPGKPTQPRGRAADYHAILGQEPNPSFAALNEILVAYLDQDAADFNQAVASYHRQLEKILLRICRRGIP